MRFVAHAAPTVRGFREAESLLLGGEAVGLSSSPPFHPSAALFGSCSVAVIIMSKHEVPSRVSDHLQVKSFFPITDTGISCPLWSEPMLAEGYWKN